MRSFAGSPNTIAPMRPLPTGSASVQILAGALYQSVRAESCASADAAARRRTQPRRIGLPFDRHWGQIATRNDAIDHAVLHGLIRLHDVIAIHVLGDAVDRLAGGVRQHLVENLTHAENLSRVDI